MTDPKSSGSPDEKWYTGITRYQWTVLVIASLGWVFDIFEGQIFVASMREAMPSLVAAGTEASRIAFYNQIALAAFLLGGAIGGIAFGALSDRIGRKRTMSFTIIFYSLFTCLSAFSQDWWHLAGFRFLVALGVGGEWAVASALVAEVFPKKARAHVGGIFHASSVLGTYLAVAAGTFFIGNAAVHAWAAEQDGTWIANLVDPTSLPWRLGFALGVLPALLILWIRKSLHEPDSWVAARLKSQDDGEQAMGSIGDLFKGALLRHTMVGVCLAAVGLATFWGAHIYGKNTLLAAAERNVIAEASIGGTILSAEERQTLLASNTASLKRTEMLGMFIVTTGGGLGLLSFGPICSRIGRRKAFLIYHIGGVISALLVFQVVKGYDALLFMLPIFGFLTLGMHAGYAIYFPELYPTRLRGTGTGFCFNAGRLIAAPILFSMGWMQSSLGLSLTQAASYLSLLYLLAIVILIFAPETMGKDLPE
jgi:MFS family permease